VQEIDRLRAIAVVPRDPVAQALALRPQARADTWALHQLYHWTTPKPAQHAEAYTSSHWEVPARGLPRGRGDARTRGFVVERGHEIAVYCRVERQGRYARLAFVFAPHGRALLAPAVAALLDWLAPGPRERVYCTVREFQEELGPVLEEQGFDALGAQDLLVRYTTVRAPAARRAPSLPSLPALDAVRPRVPAPLAFRRRRRAARRWPARAGGEEDERGEEEAPAAVAAAGAGGP
jgi:hypothetical protein